MISEWIDFFIPNDLPDPTGVEVKRARTGLMITFAAIFWALIAALLGLATESYAAVAGLMIAMVLVGFAPFVLRATGNLSLTGHCIIAPIYAALLWTIYLTGGLHSAPILWLALLPLLASIFHKKPAAKFWLLVVVLTFLAVTAATLMGFPFPPIRNPMAARLQYGVALIGLGITTFAILKLKNNVQVSLSDALRAQAAETRAVLETAPDAILTVDRSGQILSANQAAAHIFGCGRQQILNHKIHEFIVDLDASALAIQSQGNGEPLKYLGQRGADTPRVPFPLEIAFGQHAERIVLVLRDITGRLQANEALKSARDEAIEASNAKSVFLANMSHELRTPLNAVIGYSEMIQEEIEGMHEARVENIEAITGFVPDLTRIRTAGTHLLSLINDILDLSKIEAGKMNLHLEVFEVTALIDDIQSTIAPLARKSNNAVLIELDDALGYMKSDATKVRQILFNLMSNACKFTLNGRITIRVLPSDDYEEIVFEVADTGMGMSDEQLSHIFEAFTQADGSTTREFGGTGLGLTITRHFCALLGGKVEAESKLDVGSLFRVRLPSNMNQVEAAQHAAAREKRRREVTGNFRPLRPETIPYTGANRAATRHPNTHETVLVIDDDPTMRDLLRRILEREGFSVAGAASGSEGLLLAEQLHPDIITLDVMMPSMDGWTLLSLLKQNPVLRDIPVLMVTMVAERARGFALGADHYLLKPIDRRDLVNILNQYRTRSADFNNILLVEDDEPNREMVRRTLDSQGWAVCEAENGQIALDMLEDFKPDLVLLDLMMPQMDGFEFLHRFRQIEAYRDIPVIVVTAKTLTQEETIRLRKDANEILAKGGRTGGGNPLEELLAQVRNYAGGK